MYSFASFVGSSPGSTVAFVFVLGLQALGWERPVLATVCRSAPDGTVVSRPRLWLRFRPSQRCCRQRSELRSAQFRVYGSVRKNIFFCVVSFLFIKKRGEKVAVRQAAWRQHETGFVLRAFFCSLGWRIKQTPRCLLCSKPKLN